MKFWMRRDQPDSCCINQKLLLLYACPSFFQPKIPSSRLLNRARPTGHTVRSALCNQHDDYRHLSKYHDPARRRGRFLPRRELLRGSGSIVLARRRKHLVSRGGQSLFRRGSICSYCSLNFCSRDCSGYDWGLGHEQDERCLVAGSSESFYDRSGGLGVEKFPLDSGMDPDRRLLFSTFTSHYITTSRMDTCSLIDTVRSLHFNVQASFMLQGFTRPLRAPSHFRRGPS